MRYTVDLFALGLVFTAAGWLARAPAQPEARAAYLCRPVAVASGALARLEAALSDAGQVIPARHAWLPEVPLDCERMVLRLVEPDEEP